MNSNLAIRKCQPGDEHALSIVGQATFLEAFAGVIDGRDIVAHCQHQNSVEKYRVWLADPHTMIWLAEAAPGGAPIGYLVLTTPDLPVTDIGPRDLEVKRIYLLHRFHGGGTGARLMEEARAHACAAGARRLLLGVYSRNTQAISFYERLGYLKVGTKTFKVGANTYHDFVFALRLSE